MYQYIKAIQTNRVAYGLIHNILVLSGDVFYPHPNVHSFCKLLGRYFDANASRILIGAKTMPYSMYTHNLVSLTQHMNGVTRTTKAALIHFSIFFLLQVVVMN